MRGKEGVVEIASLISQIEGQEDPREGFALLQQQMARYEESGDEVPEELLRVRHAIETDLISASRGE
jgi:hypothetical protein